MSALFPTLPPPSLLTNPLATASQLVSSASQNDGVPPTLEASLRFSGCLLTQSAGILLRLSQDTIAQAVILFTRFYIGHAGGSFLKHAIKDISAASIYLAAKLSATPQSPRNIINVYAYLVSTPPFCPSSSASASATATATATATASRTPNISHPPLLTPSSYTSQRSTLTKSEAHLLEVVNFTFHAALPHPLALNYLKCLDIFTTLSPPNAAKLARRTLAYLNASLLNPQVLYTTHQPVELACAAIYLAAQEQGVSLPCDISSASDPEKAGSGAQHGWWEVFDVDRETLGFLVLSMWSFEGWVEEEQRIWRLRNKTAGWAPVTIEGLRSTLAHWPDGGELQPGSIGQS